MATSSVAIIRNAPSPEESASRRFWPFKDMNVGDAFDASIADRASLSALCSLRKRKHGEAYTIRRIDADTVRVWRLA